MVDATVKTGTMRQTEAFRAGFNQVSCLCYLVNLRKFAHCWGEYVIIQKGVPPPLPNEMENIF